MRAYFDVHHVTFWPLVFWLFFVCHRALTLKNSPTFASAAESTPAERRANLLQRLKSESVAADAIAVIGSVFAATLIYVFTVPAAAVWQPGIFGLFINVVVWLGLGEFIATVAPFRNGVKRPKPVDDYVWRSADRALQVSAGRCDDVHRSVCVSCSTDIWNASQHKYNHTGCVLLRHNDGSVLHIADHFPSGHCSI
jgi:hypothetical protein